MLSGNNSQNIELEFERIDDTSMLSNFFCGIEVMDTFIHEALDDYMKNDTKLKTYVVKHTGRVVAMFSIRPDYLELDDEDKDEMVAGIVPKPLVALSDNSFMKQHRYEAVEIAYLAVEKQMRCHGIGEYILNQLCLKVHKDYPDIQFITVGAYKSAKYSAVGFYEKCSFEPMEYPDPNCDVLRMYRVIVPLDDSQGNND